MLAPKKPTKEQLKANSAKRKADLTKKSAQEKARVEKFKSDPKAQSAVDYMTSSKGYQPDPLKSRGGSTGGAKPTVKKGTGVKPKSKPRFR